MTMQQLPTALNETADERQPQLHTAYRGTSWHIEQ